MIDTNPIKNSGLPFSSVAMTPDNPKWAKATEREAKLYDREDDIRSPFIRDYTRVLHSYAYRRLKHKTQVFYGAAGNDHICTRIEHVSHVDSVSNSIARALGLNEELTRAIAIAHDIGHAPFGHQGEKCLTALTEKLFGTKFWHEQNGVYFVENIELLEDPQKNRCNLDLTYAVRDGIISHCGELDQNGIKPRSEMFNLSEFDSVGKYEASTWEGCVVKLSDKIAYLGRDIEDAEILGYFDDEHIRKLHELAKKCNKEAVNTTVITHSMIIDICKNSSIEKGLCLSDEMAEVLSEIKKFNYENIYGNKRLSYYCRYAELIINSIFEFLSQFYAGMDTFEKLEKGKLLGKPFLNDFIRHLATYCMLPENTTEEVTDYTKNLKNRKCYGELDNEKIYQQAIIDFIAGMTDNYATEAFNQLLLC